MTYKYIIIGMSLLLLSASCGRQWQAKSAVKEFMDSELHRDAHYINFSDIDSTRNISDSLIAAMQQRIPCSNYQERRSKTLLHIRATYALEDDTLSSTFYLNKEIDGVVAFKDNF